MGYLGRKNIGTCTGQLHFTEGPLRIAKHFAKERRICLYDGDCLDFLASMPNDIADLVVTSPPYNLGKEYETRLDLDTYIEQQSNVIMECTRILSDQGSICWQVGNYVHRGSIIPLDTILHPIFASAGLKMRNRIIWHFEHGLHCSRRFSGRYEVVAWYTKTDRYHFDVDPIRVPQKYPGKRHFKGPRAGEYSCNPKGKNPSDVWVIPNVKNNHVEKTIHPCQYPVELVERLVLGMTPLNGLVVDPFLGVGSTAIAAIRHDRRVAGAEIDDDYYSVAIDRVKLELRGQLRTRPMGKAVHQPTGRESIVQNPFTPQQRSA